MMDKYILLTFVCTLIASYAYAKPAGSELDNVSVDDTSLNVVDPLKKQDIGSIPVDTQKNGASVQITGISTGIDAPSSYDGPSSPPFKPQRAGTMFARFIDDVFNIPITVLQSVAKLITNPFTSKDKTPESH